MKTQIRAQPEQSKQQTQQRMSSVAQAAMTATGFEDKRPQINQLKVLQALMQNTPRVQNIPFMSAKVESGARFSDESFVSQRITSVDVEHSHLSKEKISQRMMNEKLVGSNSELEPHQFASNPVTRNSNNTGLPDQLKNGIESLSGMSMDHVKVHYNSAQPAQLNALAYAQGNDIHLGPGQEQHLPHEAWHVVQQAQGRVKPTMQMKEGVPVNTDVSLEDEADRMGAKAIQMRVRQSNQFPLAHSAYSILNAEAPMQPKLRAQFVSNVLQLANLPDDSSGSLSEMKIPQGEGQKELTGTELQSRLIESLSKIGEKGFGYRLLSFRYEGEQLVKDDEKFHHEEHGMTPWPGNITDQLDDIRMLIKATLSAANQLAYIQENFQSISPTHHIIVDVDWYRERGQSDVGFHKDSRGTTLFVNLTYDNAEKMQSAATKPDLEGQNVLEQGFPDEIKTDLAKRRDKYKEQGKQSGDLTESELDPYSRLSFSDPSVWHSTPRLDHRVEKMSPPQDVNTLEEYLKKAGQPEYLYRGIRKFYSKMNSEIVFKFFRDQKNKKKPTTLGEKSLTKTLLKLGYSKGEVRGYQKDYTPEEFWNALNVDHKVSDKYNQHGISDKIVPLNVDNLNETVKKSKRPLSTRIEKEEGLKARLAEEAKRPRTFIRTWVRLVAKEK